MKHHFPFRTTRLSFLSLICLLAPGVPAVVPAQDTASTAFDAAPMDWPYWRGPEMNSISREKGLPSSWDPAGGEGSNLLWENKELASRSTPIVMNGKLYTICRAEPATEREGEKVVCADAATGKILWENRFNVYLSDVPDTRVGWSSVTGDPKTGRIYCQGVCGLFLCIDGETGETVWSHSLHELYGLLSTYGGRTNFPIVHNNLVIISAVIIGWGDMAKPAHRFIAFDKRNGAPVWFESTRLFPTDTTYSAPVTAIIDGQWQMAFGSGDGAIHGLQPETGKALWRYQASLRGINTSPTFADNMLVAGHSEENTDSNLMGALFALDPTKTGDIAKTGVLWRDQEWFVGKAAPLVVDGRVYALEDTGTFRVIDLKTGKEIAKQKLGTQGRGTPVYGDGKIYVCEANGRWYIMEPTDDGVKIIHRLRIDGTEASPIISHGRIYLATGETMYCIGDPNVQPSADPRPELPPLSPKSANPEPAVVQVVPVESLLRPGQKQQFDVRLYNKKGQYLKTVAAQDAAFSISGPGTMEPTGRYLTPDALEDPAPVIVTVKVGELTGTARIRVVPDLPWKFDFDDGLVPETWVGMRYRHIGIDYDLYTKLRQENPLAGQLYIYVASAFTNTGLPAQKFEDVGPRLGWTSFLRYLELLDKVITLDDAKAALDPAIALLLREKVLASAKWSEPDAGSNSLAVTKGERGVEGNGVMCKITTIPLGTRSQGWMGQDNFSNYTMQADVLGATRVTQGGDPSAKMPDIGLTVQRYRFELMGAAQELKMGSWIAHEIKYKRVPFKWDPEVWYTMKFKAETVTRDGKAVAVLSGKAWPRGQAEPSEWQITWEDVPANVQGSPGMAGNAKDAEIFIDNVLVTKNEPSTEKAAGE